MIQEWQQRVIDEKAELDDRKAKLILFISARPVFLKLPQEERDRLRKQYGLMTDYSNVLGERIAAFKV